MLVIGILMTSPLIVLAIARDSRSIRSSERKEYLVACRNKVCLRLKGYCLNYKACLFTRHSVSCSSLMGSIQVVDTPEYSAFVK